MTKMKFDEITKELSAKEIEEIEAAAKRPIYFDEDSPEMSPAMLSQFKRMNRAARNKQTISLRLSPDTIKKAKSYGKGYTSFLSRLIELAINDETLVKKCI